MKNFLTYLCLISFSFLLLNCAHDSPSVTSSVRIPSHEAVSSETVRKAVEPVSVAQGKNDEARGIVDDTNESLETISSIFDAAKFYEACDPRVFNKLDEIRKLNKKMSADMAKLYKTLSKQKESLRVARETLESATVEAVLVEKERDEAIEALSLANERIKGLSGASEKTKVELSVTQGKLEEALVWKKGVLWTGGVLALLTLIGLAIKAKTGFL
jgi:hypothetical protein